MPPVHVAISGDRAVLPGLAVAASSLLNATRFPERVQVHVITSRRDEPIVRALLKCVRAPVNVVPFQTPSLEVAAITPPRLTADMNYARLFLPELFGHFTDKVVYLDADVIVDGDVVELYESAVLRKPHALAAVPRGLQRLRLAPSVARNPLARSQLVKGGVDVVKGPTRRLTTTLQDFNAGVLVIDLHQWRDLNLTKQVLQWMTLNHQYELYTRGSNPPLVLAVRDDFERLDGRWNCPARPSSVPLSPRCSYKGIVHLTGASKPWQVDGTFDARWNAKVTPQIATCFKSILNLDPAQPSHERVRLATATSQPFHSCGLFFLLCPDSFINVLFCCRILVPLLLIFAFVARRRLRLAPSKNKRIFLSAD